ncbi:MAG: electron transfer flavoprotein subunit alpha/FixB family protein [Bacteroidota bacterium]|nr:electron transfer flavoprotein subunit alpha/FixB family protein [Bacteroidota bacterium]MDP4237291.1 electron transfer flavoprotein subunit alpha/FixB family protein [Bacteroidota bacterium]
MNILVYFEERAGSIRKPSYEAIEAARSIGATSITAVIVTASAASVLSDTVKRSGVSKIIVVEEARFAHYSSRAAGKAVAEVAKQANADVVIIPATARGKDLAPRVAVRLHAGYVPDVTALAMHEGRLQATHPVYAGKANVTIDVLTPKKVYSTRPNLWKASKEQAESAIVENVTVAFDEKDFAEQTKELVLSQGKLDVAEADIIVTAGRGMKGPENWGLIEGLASAFGAAIGASRAVVDAGWRPHSEQVGQTGKTVSPTLYVAIGVSGAIQHLAGMSSSKTIVAINKDANAPIFGVCDYGIVGDAFEVIPQLTEEVKKIKH